MGVIMKIKTLSYLGLFTCLTTPALTPLFAQDAPASVESDDADNKQQAIIVTGSSIKRLPQDSASPLQIYSTEDLAREGISNPEQFISLLNSNGNGADNLAANADVTTGGQRGINGVSSANLRNQGAGATLVLLNGRRVASHGLGGGSVDVNQIPFAALQRVEVLKDGASAIYGTDAIGGVINFITKKDFQGLSASGFIDKTEAGGGDIYKASVMAGAGDLDDNGFNIMVGWSYSENKILRGTQRDFVTTNLPSFGLVADTRGTPFATIFAQGSTALNTSNTLLIAANAPFIPGSTTVRGTAVNPLDIPGGAGCSSVPGMFAYDEQLWPGALASAYACAYETGKPAVLTQPLQTLSLYAKATGRFGDHEISLEYMRSDADAKKSFSENQLSNNNTNLQLRYPRNALTAPVYDRIVSQLQTAFPGIALNVGAPIAYRWRCLECGPRAIDTRTNADRIFLGAEGPFFGGWEYRAGASRASSQSKSKLGEGYFYRGTNANGTPDPLAPTAPGATTPGIVGVLNSGLINIFLLPGETQSAAGLAALEAISARGVVLSGGKYTVTQFDGSVSGSILELPGGMAMGAVGLDYRKEEYSFNGDVRSVTNRPNVFNAPFDPVLSDLTSRSRTIKAAYAELLLPLFSGFELNAAVRTDEYSGFGRTTNPKVSFKYQAIDQIMFRGSFNTGFRVPSFNQIYKDTVPTPLPGADLADPRDCPNGTPIAGNPLCAPVNPEVLSGGTLNLGPETSKQFGLGVVLQPSRNFSATVDYWKIDRSGTISDLSVTQLAQNYTIFADRFIRNGAGQLIQIDRRFVNAGKSFTQGIDVSLRGAGSLAGGEWSVGMDGTYLLSKKRQIIPSVPVGANEVGVFDFANDLSLRWKHNAYVTYGIGDFGFSLSQIFRLGYRNGNVGRVKSGEITRPDVVTRTKDYVTYNFSTSYEVNDNLKLIAGVKNIFDTDPPFAITYDTDTGAGSSWEPRVADPRGRAFTLQVDAHF
jgi:iron complex outermembrane recepter protein